jgi:hypothetical protein
MTLNDSTSTAGTWVTTVTSGIGALLTLYIAFAPTRGTPPSRTRHNLLAPFFDRPLAFGTYPPIVWSYLNEAAPGDSVTRKQRLLESWQRLGLVGDPSSPDAHRRLDALTRPIVPGREVQIDVLQDRSLMLADVRARIDAMKQGLLALLQAIDGS